jgi:hypothetical protein
MNACNEAKLAWRAVSRAAKRGGLPPLDRCAVCGARAEDGAELHRHHPEGYGPQDRLNVVVLCRLHHSAAHAYLRLALGPIACRLRGKLTSQQIAHALGVSRSSITRWFRLENKDK